MTVSGGRDGERRAKPQLQGDVDIMNHKIEDDGRIFRSPRGRAEAREGRKTRLEISIRSKSLEDDALLMTDRQGEPLFFGESDKPRRGFFISRQRLFDIDGFSSVERALSKLTVRAYRRGNAENINCAKKGLEVGEGLSAMTVGQTFSGHGVRIEYAGQDGFFEGCVFTRVIAAENASARDARAKRCPGRPASAVRAVSG